MEGTKVRTRLLTPSSVSPQYLPPRTRPSQNLPVKLELVQVAEGEEGTEYTESGDFSVF